MDEDRLRWIYAATSAEELRERYDEWAATYDTDLVEMQWLAPFVGARQCARFADVGDRILDAGCGTGQVGVALRELGFNNVVGFDFSPAMLERAGSTGAYAELRQGSLLDELPFAEHSFDAVVSVGVFTYGHVGPTALERLTRVVKAQGHVSITFRDDAVHELGYVAEADRLAALGVWHLVDRTEPSALIAEDGGGADMRAWTWRVSPVA